MVDPTAIVALLNAFYLPCSPANLARARRERPEYFAGGTLIGKSGDALQLPDGDVWDLIFDVDDPNRRRYQAIRPGGAGAAGDDPFRLAPGPLAFLEPDDFPPPQFERTFETLIGRLAPALGGADAAVGADVAIITAAADPAGLDAETEDLIGGAARDTDGHAASLYTVLPTDEIARAGELVDTTYVRENDYPDPNGAPGDVPVGDPGPRPRDEPPPKRDEDGERERGER